MLLEGTDIRALLQQVRDEYGPEARIVHAERIRSGGVGGFFAKQRYEVAVEVDADVAADRPAPTRTSTASTSVTVAPTTTMPTWSEAVAAATRPADAQRAAIDLVLDGLPSSEANPAPRPSLVPAALIETDLPLEREARSVVDPRPVLTPVGPSANALHIDAEPTPAFDLVAQLHAQRDEALGTTISPSLAAALAEARLVEAAAARLGDAAPAKVGSVTPAAANPAVTSAPWTPIADAVAETLAPVLPMPGMPTSAPVAEEHVAAPLAPRRPGDVLVLVGDPVAGYEAALAIAASGRMPAQHVHVVSDRADLATVPADQLVSDVLEARLRGAQLAMNRTAGIVVVDAPLSLVADPQGQAWVADVVAAVGAVATWALVDATRRPEDLHRWLQCVPRPEALVAHGAALTSDPGAVHTLGVPVAVVDGRAVLVEPQPVAAYDVSASAPVVGTLTHRRTS